MELHSSVYEVLTVVVFLYFVLELCFLISLMLCLCIILTLVTIWNILIKVVICGKYKNLNKITKVTYIPEI